ncbi:TPA: hypothetical protein N0F65_011820, partial [Lagenidium giganteum]
MTVPQPQRERQHYEKKLAERCSVTGEQLEAVTVSVRSSVDPRILDHLARYVFKRSSTEILDSDIEQAVKRRCDELRNGHLPDVA